MKVYIVIETADIELTSVVVFKDREKAAEAFEACAKKNGVSVCDDLDGEIEGTIAMAGDDAYAVQVIEQTIQE